MKSKTLNHRRDCSCGECTEVRDKTTLEIHRQAYLTHADDHKNGFKAGVRAAFELFTYDPSSRRYYFDDITLHQNPKISHIVIEMLQGKK